MITLKDITPIKRVELSYSSDGIDYQTTFIGFQFRALMLSIMRKRDYEDLYDLIIAACKVILRNEKEIHFLDRIETFEVIVYDEYGFKQRITK